MFLYLVLVLRSCITFLYHFLYHSCIASLTPYTTPPFINIIPDDFHVLRPATKINNSNPSKIDHFFVWPLALDLNLRLWSKSISSWICAYKSVQRPYTVESSPVSHLYGLDAALTHSKCSAYDCSCVANISYETRSSGGIKYRRSSGKSCRVTK